MTDPVSGIDSVLFVKAESAFDTAIAYVGGDALDFMEFELTPVLQEEERTTHTGSRSFQGHIEGRRSGTWRLKTAVKVGALGTPNDDDVITEAAFGKAGTDTSSTSVAYTLGAVTDAARSLQFTRVVGAGFAEQANGCWVEQRKIVIPPDGTEPFFEYSGGFATYSMFRSGPAVEGAHTAPDTTIALETGDGKWLLPNIRIKFGSEDNSGAGYLVTAISTDTITISPGLANNVSDAAVLAPFLPSPTITGTPLGSVNCGLEIDSVSYDAKRIEITQTTGVMGLNAESTRDRPNRIVNAGQRRSTAVVEVFALSALGGIVGGAWGSDTHAFVFRIGEDVSGARHKITFLRAIVKVSPIAIPDADAAAYTLEIGPAEQSAAANDEHSELIS